MLACPVITQVPTKAQVNAVTEDLRSRSKMPSFVKPALEALPDNTHPMTQFSVGVMALQVNTQKQHGNRLGPP